MWIYLIAFVLSCLLIKIATSTNDKRIFYLFSVIGILLPCVLAGVRADTIGTDVRVYVEPMVEAAKQSTNIADFFTKRWYVSWRYKSPKDYEIGYTLIVYFITKVFNSLPTVLFVIHLIILVPLYEGLLYFKEKIPVWFGLLVFYLLYFNLSLNMMRQWIAMAILLYALRYLIKNDVKKYAVAVAIGLLFHISAIIGVMIYFIFRYTTRQQCVSQYYKIGNYVVDASINKAYVILIIGMFVLMGLNIVTLLARLVGLSDYIYYISGSIYFVPNQLLVRAPIAVLFLLNYRWVANQDELAPFWLSMIFLDLVSSQLTSISAYSFRISTLFSEYVIISVPLMIASVPRKGGMRTLMRLILLCYLIFYWWYFYVYIGNHATVPYISIFN